MHGGLEYFGLFYISSLASLQMFTMSSYGPSKPTEPSDRGVIHNTAIASLTSQFNDIVKFIEEKQLSIRGLALVSNALAEEKQKVRSKV